MVRHYPQIKTLWPLKIGDRCLIKFHIARRRDGDVNLMWITPYYSSKLEVDCDPYDTLIRDCKEYGGVGGHLETFAVDDSDELEPTGYGHRRIMMGFRLGDDPGERLLKKSTADFINLTIIKPTLRVFPVEYSSDRHKKAGSWAYSTC